MTDQATTFGRGVSFPPRVDADGRVATSAGPDNVRQSIRIILMTERQERLMLPRFGGGLRSFLFKPNTAAVRQLMAERAERTLARWEPRIKVESVTVQPDPRRADDQRAAVMVIEYRLVATGASDRLNVTLQFAG